MALSTELFKFLQPCPEVYTKAFPTPPWAPQIYPLQAKWAQLCIRGILVQVQNFYEVLYLPIPSLHLLRCSFFARERDSCPHVPFNVLPQTTASLQNTRIFTLQVVYEWATGTPFEEISRLTDVMEGSIVRCVVRLDEQCRQLMDAARVMGNTALFQQMEAASAAIKRDVVFAASLYTS